MGHRPRGARGLSRRGLSPRTLPAWLVVILLVIFAPISASAVTIKQVGQVLDAVGGNVYITSTPTGENAQFWANGAWHDFSELDPADKATQNGPSVDIGNGWWIWWDHSKYDGGSYVVWRYPDNGQLTYDGSRWPGFKVRLNKIGYTSTGETIDSIIDFPYIYAWQYDGLPEPNWITPFQISKLYGPLVAAEGHDSSISVGVDTQFVTTLVKTGTDTQIDASSQMDIVYWDIDQPLHYTPSGAFTADFTSEWREGVHLVDGYKDEAIVGTGTTLKISDNNTWFRSGANDPSGEPTNQSTVIAKAGPQFTTGWRGEGCSTGIGYDSKVVIYPTWPEPVKSPPQQIYKRGETATFEVSENFPYVADSNKASSIVMTDTLDPALDASRATVRVLKDNVDVTGNWQITINGQTITATAINTGHGYAESNHVFRITAPVSTTTDLSAYPTVGINGVNHWQFLNQATVTIGGQPKTTNTVEVLVPYEAKGRVGLTGTKKLLGHALAPGQFSFDLKDSTGVILQTVNNDATGAINFADLEYTQEDIGKTFTYTITEHDDGVRGYAYDTHAETVTVSVSDAGQGVLDVAVATDGDGLAFTNEYKNSLGVAKQSSTDGSPLADARFTLYTDDGDGVFDDGDQPAVVFSDVDLTAPIPGAEITTTADGNGIYHGLSADTTYWLRETRAPAGFNLDGTPHLIRVSAQGEVTTLDDQGTSVPLPLREQTATITISDDPIPGLPATAGPGVTGLLFAGTFLIVTGSGVVLLRRRLDQEIAGS